MNEYVSAGNGHPVRPIPILVYHPEQDAGTRLERIVARAVSRESAQVIRCQESNDIAQFDQKSLPVIVVMPLHEQVQPLINRKFLCNVRTIIWDEASETTVVQRTELTLNGVRSIACGGADKLIKAVVQQTGEARREADRRQDLVLFSVIHTLIGHSPVWLRVLDDIVAIAPRREEPILMYGRTGTGKELAATAIHKASNAPGPLKTVHCAYINGPLARSELFGHVQGAFTDARKEHRGIIEEAKGGTVVLDDIQLLDLKTQGELLRTLEEGTVLPVGSTKEIDVSDVRFIFATNVDLLAAIKAGEFREDLYYRLNVLQLNLPTLQEREDDISLLANHFLSHYTEKYDSLITAFSDEVLQIFELLPWPGNVRQLRNTVISAITRKRGGGTTLELADLPVDTFRGLNENLIVELTETAEKVGPDVLVISKLTTMAELYKKAERWAITKSLRANNGNQSKAAKILDITRGKIRDRIAEFGITVAREVGFETVEEEKDET